MAESMSVLSPRAEKQHVPEKSPRIARTCPADDSDDERCSYEEQRDKRVARMRELLKPLVLASKNM